VELSQILKGYTGCGEQGKYVQRTADGVYEKHQTSECFICRVFHTFAINSRIGIKPAFSCYPAEKWSINIWNFKGLALKEIIEESYHLTPIMFTMINKLLKLLMKIYLEVMEQSRRGWCEDNKSQQQEQSHDGLSSQIRALFFLNLINVIKNAIRNTQCQR